jgi:hypothetical protein
MREKGCPENVREVLLRGLPSTFDQFRLTTPALMDAGDSPDEGVPFAWVD